MKYNTYMPQLFEILIIKDNVLSVLRSRWFA